MRILLLTQWYPPEPAHTPEEFITTLHEFGYDVEVLTGFPNYPSGNLFPGYKLRPWMKEERDGIPIGRAFLYPDHSRSGFKRALNYISFALSSAILGKWLVQKPDIIFVYHPPLTIGIPGIILSKLWRIPFVYQVQDMWPETLRATGMLSNERILHWIDVFARAIYKRANAICVISPGFRRNLIEKGVPDEKLHVISNWVDTSVYYPAEPDAELAQKLGLDGKFNIMYGGNIGAAQALDVVLEAANRLQDHPQIQFVLVGDGVALPALQQKAQAMGLTNVKFLGRYPAAEMANLYALADVLLVHLKDDPLFQITIPHKIFAYLASAKPILAAVRGDAADVIEEIGAGLVCPPEDVQALVETTLAFYEMSDEELAEMGERGLRSVQEQFNKQKQVAELADVLKQTVADYAAS